MKLKIALLADFASISVGDKLNILGIFDYLYTENVPCRHPQMQLVTRMEFDSSEAGSKDIKIDLVDADGKELFSISGELIIERAPDGRPTSINQILALNNLNFPKFGEYEFKILVNNDLKDSVPLEVRKSSQQQ